jgi:hypothetical protein
MASIIYKENLFGNDKKNSIIHWLTCKKYKKGINNDGSIIKREQLWFQKDQLPFNKKWEKFDRWCSEKIYEEILYDIENHINIKSYGIELNINSCLINKYEDGRDFIKFHNDSYEAFGENHYIILVSFGETRTLRFRDKTNKENYFDKILKDNSLLIVFPDINMKYEHSILKDDTKNKRYSLTFRNYITKDKYQIQSHPVE